MSKLQRWRSVFGYVHPAIIGMIHVRALPGTPKHSMSIAEIVGIACKEAEIYKRANVDAVLIENMHDIPYNTHHEIGPEIVSVMTRICHEVRKTLGTFPCGVQILAAGNKEALAVAKAADLQFIRTEGFVFGHIADEGLMNACAGPLLRYRKYIGADNVLVFTDIKKKHASHILTGDVDIVDTAKAAEFFLSDGVIITGTSTGSPAKTSDIFDVQKHIRIPTLVGSGITRNNILHYCAADGLIVGSHFKKNHQFSTLYGWENDLDEDKIQHFMDAVLQLRNSKTREETDEH